MAGNPYHDAEGQFCSRDGMQSSIDKLAAAGDLDGYFKLRNELEAIDKSNSVKKQAKDITPVKPELTAEEIEHFYGLLGISSTRGNPNTGAITFTKESMALPVKGESTEVSTNFAAELAKIDGYYNFTVVPGRRFDKIIQASKKDTSGGQRFVHAFIDRETGDLIKPAGWSAPQRNPKTGALAIRYNLSTKEGFKEAVEAASNHNGYLYAK